VKILNLKLKFKFWGCYSRRDQWSL